MENKHELKYELNYELNYELKYELKCELNINWKYELKYELKCELKYELFFIKISLRIKSFQCFQVHHISEDICKGSIIWITCFTLFSSFYFGVWGHFEF